MRRPTTEDEALSWWRDWVAGLNPPIHEDHPMPGYYQRRYTKDGPLVPVRIYWHQEIDPETGELTTDERLVAESEGRDVDPVRIWTYLTPITLEKYEFLLEHARVDSAMAATHVPLDLSKTPIRP